MARRRGGGIPRRLIVAVALATVVACAGPGVTAETTAPAPSSLPPTTTSTTVPTTTTTVPTTTTTVPATTSTLPAVDAVVTAPEGDGPWPAVVLVHGGGWVSGSPDLMAGLAAHLAAEGYLAVNAAYTLAGSSPGFPQAVDDVACAVRYAAAHPDGDGTVALVGHSAGAHLAALVALDGDGYGATCPVVEEAPVSRLVGLAGPYEVGRLGPLLLPFFGVSPSEDPLVWEAGDPFSHVDGNPGLEVLLLHGEQDTLVDLSFATDFAAALTTAGKVVEVDVIEEANHSDMDDPAFVGEPITAWLSSGNLR